MAHQWIGTERLARRAFDDLAGGVAPAVLVDMLAGPVEERPELASRDKPAWLAIDLDPASLARALPGGEHGEDSPDSPD